MPDAPFTGVVIANELLDNLPFDVAERTEDGWAEVRVGLDADRIVEEHAPIDDAGWRLLPDTGRVPVGARLPARGLVGSSLGQQRNADYD